MTAESSIVSGLAGRYASALFALALQEKQADPVLGHLETLAALVDQSPDFARVIRSPVVPREQQARAIAAVMQRVGIAGLAAKFVGLVTQNRRLFLLSQMTRAYRILLSQHKGEVAAEVTSARPLDPAQLDAVRAKLAKAAGREVSLSAKVDAKILGGLIVRLGSTMVDSSIRTKLLNLQNAMKEIA